MKSFFQILLGLLVSSPLLSLAEYDKEEFRLLVRENLPKFSQCYEESPAAKAGVPGKLVVQINLDEKGDVKLAKAVTAKSTLHDAVVEKCVTDKLKSMHFPVPPPGDEVEINYPFVFGVKKTAITPDVKAADKPVEKTAEKPAEKPAEVKSETKSETKTEEKK